MDFHTIHTYYGLKRLAQAEASGVAINLSHAAVGDGNGNPVTPAEGMTQLVRERYRTTINRVYQDPDEPRGFIAEVIIPAAKGGFTLREVGLYDDQGSLFVIGNLPDTYKPLPGEGAYSDAVLRVQFLAANTSFITLNVDPNLAVASHTWVLNTFAKALIIPGGTARQVLAKTSNTDGDYAWTDPTEAKVTVRSIEEIQTLAADQTVVSLAKTTTVGLAVYIAGARLRAGEEWKAISTTTLRLSSSYPAGTKIILAQNDPLGTFFDPLLRAQNLADVPDKAQARANLELYSKSEVEGLIPRVPAGTVVYFAGTTAPTGWFKANGAAISRTAYAELFAALGTFHGAGDGFTTFNLPDLRGEFIRSLDDGRGVDKGRGLGTAQGSQNQEHSHAGRTATAGAHSHSYMNTDTFETSTSGLSGGNNFTDRDSYYSTSTNGDHSHALTIDPSGGSEARPRNVALLAIIKY
ncbi:phage tail protein [Pseudomonas rhizoryzae]|uniref:phage tail-collar fiber domain-containing protein n=1 Tax=Pseudomonas rhizoryzae TaxID=2571129 RepID=UPI0007362869|nr:phage tail protein [Pseudomonas rhizoryzae]KTT25136.1 tail protein [Pseudomonas psychrotolerans]KTT33518.1 tail protein [Pseudomonas psychrotolerans]KTT73244.1 tail protein [Pseudomonas psychrotolerans]